MNYVEGVVIGRKGIDTWERYTSGDIVFKSSIFDKIGGASDNGATFSVPAP